MHNSTAVENPLTDQTRQIWCVLAAKKFLIKTKNFKEKKKKQTGEKEKFYSLSCSSNVEAGYSSSDLWTCRWDVDGGGVEGKVSRRLTQWDSPLTELPSPLGEEERERPFSVFSELEPFWLWWSADDTELEEVAEVAEGLAFSLKSVMMTVRSPTVTSKCWALLRSMFFSLGLMSEWKRPLSIQSYF